MAKRKRQIIARSDPAPIRYLFYLISLFLFIYIWYEAYLFDIGQVSFDTGNALISIAASLLFFTISISYLLIRKLNLKQIAASLGISRDRLNLRAMMLGAYLFIFVIFMEVATSAISTATGIPLPTNVQQVLGNEPLYLLLFAVFISPITEETFFRGLLIPRLNTLFGWFTGRFSGALSIGFSALIFALFHTGYMSISEFVAAFLFGVAAGYVFKRSGSLYASMLAHFLVNLIAVAALLSLGPGGI